MTERNRYKGRPSALRLFRRSSYTIPSEPALATMDKIKRRLRLVPAPPQV